MGYGYGTILECVDVWFNEYKEYVDKGVDPLKYVGSGDMLMQKHNLSQTNGHFTAMVTAHTNKLGCGMIRG